MFLRFFLFVFLFNAFLANSQVRLRETMVDTTTVATGLDIPWEIIWGPDDFLWITERYGRVSRINPVTGEQYVLKIIEEVQQEGESGLLGMALHPDFFNKPQVFLVYTYLKNQEITEKLVRFDYENGTLQNPFILMDDIPGSFNHTGSRIIFLPDTTILFTTGDALNAEGSQDLDFLGGKALRINQDGSIPSDNPYPGSPVWAYGLRNSQGLVMAPSGILYSSEHGPATDDEINILEKGRNYGWPFVNGFCELPEEIDFCNQHNVVEPIINWTPTIAPSGITFYNHAAIPEFNNAILVSVLKNQRIVALTLIEDGKGVMEEVHYFQDMFGRVRDVVQGPSGEIYIINNGPHPGTPGTFTHSIIKIENKDFSKELNENKMIIFPNPAKEGLNIIIAKDQNISEIRFLDQTGKTILTRSVTGNYIRHGTEMFSPGMYYVQFLSGNSIAGVRKLIVK